MPARGTKNASARNPTPGSVRSPHPSTRWARARTGGAAGPAPSITRPAEDFTGRLLSQPCLPGLEQLIAMLIPIHIVDEDRRGGVAGPKVRLHRVLHVGRRFHIGTPIRDVLADERTRLGGHHVGDEL